MATRHGTDRRSASSFSGSGGGARLLWQQRATNVIHSVSSSAIGEAGD
ncbi:hypothetical protein ACFZC6_37935 [Streptomyces ossamyceticus]|uniref:Uncharacterized protein n=1 Tax=Streptomyces ossamyceticus TaxID=249581 RepID=A0ABV2V3D2_9ACTN